MADREGLGDLPMFDTDIFDGKNMAEEEEIYENDYQYMTKMYSATAREILEFIEDICDQMEYEGSMMFDEYMDRTGILTMADKVYDKVMYHEKEECQKKDRMLYQMVLALLGGEMCHRRCRHRRKIKMFG